MNSAFLALERYLLNLPLSKEAVESVLNCFSIKVLARNAYFARSGEIKDRLGFVVNGLFAMQVERPGLPAYIKDFLKEGDFLLATFDPQSENLVTIQALQESRILEARYSDIQMLNERFPEFHFLAERGMQHRYQAICDRLEEMSTLDARGRYSLFQSTFGDLEENIPQYLVASYIGVTPTQLSRIRNSPEKSVKISQQM